MSPVSRTAPTTSALSRGSGRVGSDVGHLESGPCGGRRGGVGAGHLRGAALPLTTVSSGDDAAARAAARVEIEAAAAVWADPTTPAPAWGECPDQILHFLATQPSPLLRAVLGNPQVPDAVKTAIARRARGFVRTALVWDLVEYSPAQEWLLLSDAFTPALLSRALRSLDHRPRRRPGPTLLGRDAAAGDGGGRSSDTLGAAVARGLTLSASHRQRALAAQTFALTLTARHDWSGQRLSAPRLVGDPHPVVRRALARNPNVADLPEDEAGLALRSAAAHRP